MNLHASAVDLLNDWQAPDAGQDTLRHAVLAFLAARPDGCLRACVPGHVTASTLIVSANGDEVLLTLHPRLGRWVQVGGHCEEVDSDIRAAALREATEESGIADLSLHARLAAIHVHPVTCSLGVPTRHLDMQFLARAPEHATAVISEESLDLRWWPIDGLPEDTDPGLAKLVTAARRQMSPDGVGRQMSPDGVGRQMSPDGVGRQMSLE